MVILRRLPCRSAWHARSLLLAVAVCVATMSAGEAPAWPPRDGLLLAWTTAGDPVIANDGNGKKLFKTYYQFTPHGQVIADHAGAMRIEGGGLVAPKVEEALTKAISAANAVTLEALITPTADPAEIATIVALAGADRPNLAICHGPAGFLLRTMDAAGAAVDVPLFAAPSRPTQLIVSRQGGTVTWYRDGEPAGSRELAAAAPPWQPGSLVLGDPEGRGPAWRGIVEGVVVLARAVGPDEARAHARAYHERIAARPATPVAEVEATLVAAPGFPERPRSSPYQQAYGIFEVQVDRVLSGECPAGRIRVARWLWIDYRLQAAATQKVGDHLRLRLEPFAANPHLGQEQVFDVQNVDVDMPVFYDAGPLALPAN
jgi:hypothetical protein